MATKNSASKGGKTRITVDLGKPDYNITLRKAVKYSGSESQAAAVRVALRCYVRLAELVKADVPLSEVVFPELEHLRPTASEHKPA